MKPAIELEKGKLGQDLDKKSEKDDSNGNIFDDDFIRSDFANEGSYQNQEPNQLTQEEEEDHHKFVQKIQECFSSKLMAGSDKRKSSNDFIDDNERARKQKQFSALRLSGVDENIRNSLSDLSEEPNFNQRRDRSCSNEGLGFDLPPLPDLNDNKDLNGNEELTENYQSNEHPLDLADLDPSSPEDFVVEYSN